MRNFWARLPKPFFVQAPMEDVTDAAFRRMFVRHGKPHVMYTEFTSADGLVLAPDEHQKYLLKKLLYSEGERPIVAQIFSAAPERMEKAAALAQELGFDGFDINMGCPVDAVVKTGSGAGLIKNPALAVELIRAAKRGAPDIPVSVKTRIGFNQDELDTWVPTLLREEPVALTIHARTRKEMSLVPAHWDAVRRAVGIRDALGSPTNIIGNGDVQDLAEARVRVAETGCDGVMIGRGLYGNPWFFSGRTEEPSPEEKMAALVEHLQLFESLLGETTNYATMKKHFKAYISGWDHAKDLRVELMSTASPGEARTILSAIMTV